jgi:WD40 repeat protein
VLHAPDKRLRAVVFDPLGRWLAAAGEGLSTVFVWPTHTKFGAYQSTRDGGGPVLRLTASPRGDLLAAGGASGLWLVPVDGRASEQLPGFKSLLVAVAFDREGKRLAAAGGLGGDLMAPGESVIRVWDVDTRQVQILDAGDRQAIGAVEFLHDGKGLLSEGVTGLHLWDLTTGKSTRLMEGIANTKLGPDGRRVIAVRGQMRPGGIAGTAVVFDLQTRQSLELPSHGTEVSSVAWHPAGQVVTGSRDGIVRIGGADGAQPHLLIGHEAPIWSVAVAPDGQRIASTGDDGTVRLWPIPEGQPFHTLPFETLIQRLRSLTNYRIVADSTTPSGYRLDFEPFTGWNRKPPTW